MQRAAVVLFAFGCFSIAVPAAAQTVYYPDPPPAARPDSARPGSGTAPRDTTRPDSAPTAPAPTRQASPQPPPPPPPAPVDPVVARACRDAAPGESAPDLLGVVFVRGSSPESRDEVITAVGGKRLSGTAEDEFQYIQVAAGGSEFRLRAIADKLIRFREVSEVGPVACPAPLPAPPAPGQ
jgi:hypothetical protein